MEIPSRHHKDHYDNHYPMRKKAKEVPKCSTSAPDGFAMAF